MRFRDRLLIEITNLADADLASDLFIRRAGDHQRHDLTFARSERCVTVAERLYLSLVTKRSVATLDGVPDGAQQASGSYPTFFLAVGTSASLSTTKVVSGRQSKVVTPKPSIP